MFFKGLLLNLLMKSHLIAVTAEFVDFHLGRMGLLVAGGVVILLAADGALEDDLIAFLAGHGVSLSFESPNILA